MEKIRIVHVTQAMGGVKTHIKYILSHCNPQEFEFEVIAPMDAEFMEFAVQRNIPYHVVGFKRNISPWSDLRSVICLWRLIRRGRYDIIHLHSAKAGILGRVVTKLQRRKSVFTPNGFSYLGATGVKRGLFFMIETAFKNSATRFFAVSNCEANRARFELGVKEEKIVVIQNAIQPFPPLLKKESRDVRVISTIGRLTAQKNLTRFVDIAHSVLQFHPELKFRILGAGFHDDQKEEIEASIRSYGLGEKIEIIQWSHDNTIAQYLRETDVYVSTSVFEGLPYSILEAMSLGIPCVASFCDGNNDIITTNVDGFLCNSNAQFVQAIRKLIGSIELRSSIGQEAIHTVKRNHDIRENCLVLSEAYRSLRK